MHPNSANQVLLHRRAADGTSRAAGPSWPLRAQCRPAIRIIVGLAALASGACKKTQPGNRESQAKPAELTWRFVDASADAGLDATIHCGGRDKDHILESTGSGVAFLDFDGDELLDVYLVNAWALDEDPSRVRVKGRNRLYRNTGKGHFQDVTDASGTGDDGWGCGVCVGDFDGDGRDDIYVTNFGPNRLYRALGNGKFEQVAERAGVADSGWGGGAAFFDADGDRDLDLYVVNYIDCTMDEVLTARRTNRWQSHAKVMSGPFGMQGGRDRFYRNNGDGTFTDATDEAGLTDTAEAYGLGVIASDLDEDGDVDVYVANDSNPNFLYRNNGDGTFTDVGAWSGAAFSASGAAQAGMGVDAGDFDGDGLQDIFVTNFARDHCTIYRNLGGLYFEDVSAKAGVMEVTHAPLSWGCGFLDVEHDGDNDLLIVNGHIYPQVDDFPELGEKYRQVPLLLRNENGHFEDATSVVSQALPSPVSGRGLAIGDYDNDGDLDILISGIDAPPVLLRNDTAGLGHWIKLRLQSKDGAMAINSRVTLEIGGRTQVREVRSGSTYQSQSSTDLHFGLGGATSIDRLAVVWPDGTTHTRHDVPADQFLTIRED